MTPPSPPRAPVATTRWAEIALWALLVGVFTGFSALAVPHLTNNVVGDLEFSGWSGAAASDLLQRSALYQDFVLPIPPGSMAILAEVEKLGGRALILNELRLIAVCQLGMTALAYVVARRFTSRQNAWLVAFASLSMLLRGPKECAYDHTAELCAWASIALGALGLTAPATRWRRLLWPGAGFCAAFTFAFKQSTATGVVLGWAVALFYLGVLRILARRSLRALVRPSVEWVAGAATGLALLGVLLVALGSSLGAYYQAVFADGPSLKGGSLSLGANLLSYVLASPAYPSSLVLTLLAAGVLVRLARRPGAWSLTDLGSSPVSPRAALGIALPVLLVFGAAILLVHGSARSLPNSVLFWGDRLRYLPGYGLLFACIYFVAQLGAGADQDRAARERSHALNAIFLVALVTSLLHNLSSPEFRPFYDPNPLIPLAFLYLFGALDRAALGRTKLVVYALAVAALFSPKLDRMLQARVPFGQSGYWAGMYVNDSAIPLVHAAHRVQELTEAGGEVLVLPEDLELRGLIGRPRPKLRGAVIFVDQYAARLADDDLATLERGLPKVVVIRPAEREVWIRMFALWTSKSGARRVTERFLDDWLPKHYVKDSTYSTRFDVMMVGLEVWVRRD